MLPQILQAVLFQGDIVVIVQVIDTHDAATLFQQNPDSFPADETGRSRYYDFIHGIHIPVMQLDFRFGRESRVPVGQLRDISARCSATVFAVEKKGARGTHRIAICSICSNTEEISSLEYARFP
jgi:hypothetical protein